MTEKEFEKRLYEVTRMLLEMIVTINFLMAANCGITKEMFENAKARAKAFVDQADAATMSELPFFN